MAKKNEFVYMYTLVRRVLDDEKINFEIRGKSDDFKWSEASTPKGALMGALACGVQLQDIEIGMYVPDFNEVLMRAGGR